MTDQQDDLPNLPSLDEILEGLNNSSEQSKTIPLPQHPNCIILERNTGDGRIRILKKDIVCSYFALEERDSATVLRDTLHMIQYHSQDSHRVLGAHGPHYCRLLERTCPYASEYLEK